MSRFLLSRQQHTRDLADDLGRCMSQADDERQLLHQEIVGAVANVVDDHLDSATKPNA